MSNKEELKGRELMAAKSLAFYGGEYSEDADIPHLYCFMAKAMVEHGRLITKTETLHAKWEAEGRVAELEALVEKQQNALCASRDNLSEAYRRNEGLQKGHATLTRRVQELESELKAEKERGITVMSPRGMECYSRDGVLLSRTGLIDETPVSVADSKLQADIEALTKRVTEVERCMFTPASFEEAVGYRLLLEQFPGGALYELRRR